MLVLLGMQVLGLLGQYGGRADYWTVERDRESPSGLGLVGRNVGVFGAAYESTWDERPGVLRMVPQNRIDLWRRVHSEMAAKQSAEANT